MGQANAGYYATHDPFQDFTTAPEITQVFGELLGAWAAVVWEQMGSPGHVILAECGPGRGTLMADARRATARIASAFHAACAVHLIETSRRLREQQAARVPGAVWHETLGTLPDAPMILIANEFFDALPIRQFVHHGHEWRETYVEDASPVLLPISKQDIPFVVGPDPTIHAVPHSVDSATSGTRSRDGCERSGVDARIESEDRDRIAHGPSMAGEPTREHSPASHAIIAEIAGRLARHGGGALILDYGPARSGPGNTLQALHRGRPADPLADPGSRDLTAHVDFAALARTASAAGAAVHGPLPQGPFLAALGLFQRTGVLARTQGPAKAAQLVQSAQRLAEPNRMGGLFKAMALTHPGQPTPPGFAAP